MSTFLRQLYFELLKLFARKRTYLGFAAFVVIELLILMGLHTPHAHQMFLRAMRPNGLDFSHYFSGLTLAYVMMSYTVFILGSLYMALVCGDIISKEVEDGTMRMVLSRPVSRGRILLLKLLACAVYTFSLVFFIIASSLVVGIVDRGYGGLIVIVPWEHVFAFYEGGPGLWRFFLAGGVLGLLMLTFAALGFMFSCFNMKPSTATIMTLSVYLFDSIIRGVPYFEHLQGYLLTHHMAMWIQVFQPEIPWPKIGYSILYLGLFDLLFVSIGTWYFARRDFKS
jgi:ABC-2 type transport system permease protein